MDQVAGFLARMRRLPQLAWPFGRQQSYRRRLRETQRELRIGPTYCVGTAEAWHLLHPHPLWAERKKYPLTEQGIADFLRDGRPPVTGSPTTDSNSDVPTVGSIPAPTLLSWPSGRRTTWTRHAGQHSPFAVRQDVSPDSE